jgi:prepilin-type N-terminal cleavage/methylation domain-containing protein
MGTLIQIREWKGRSMGDQYFGSRPWAQRGQHIGQARGPQEGPLAQGFTLIELLVVIAVIAVLMAILFPVLRKARESARRARCMAQMRQVQLGWQTYADDNNGRIVNGRPQNDSTAPSDSKPWLTNALDLQFPHTAAEGQAMMRTGALAQYIGDPRVYMCPSRYHGMAPTAEAAVWEWLGSYHIVPTMNFFTPPGRWTVWDRIIRANWNVGRTVLFIRKTSELVYPGPASRAVFVDRGLGYAADMPYRNEDATDWLALGTHTVWFTPIHHEAGSCMSFADGHVEYWKWKDPSTLAGGRAHMDYSVLGAIDRPASWMLDYITPDNPDVMRVHTAIWGRSRGK